MAWILWYPYKREIICRKSRQHNDLRKKEFLYVRSWDPWHLLYAEEILNISVKIRI